MNGLASGSAADVRSGRPGAVSLDGLSGRAPTELPATYGVNNQTDHTVIVRSRRAVQSPLMRGQVP